MSFQLSTHTPQYQFGDSNLLSQVHELLACAAHLDALMVGGFNVEDSLMCWTILPATNSDTVKVHGQDIPTQLCPGVIYWLKCDLDTVLNQFISHTGVSSRNIQLAYHFTPDICKELAELSTGVMTGEATVPHLEMEYALAGFAPELQETIETNNPNGLVFATKYEIPITPVSNSISLSVQ